ncbi:MAG: hypothetical protein LBJ38_00070 [Oscillospiraceae bacterium]|nr:hypothetical protein [Oscillospiraceae bacterium]
MNCIWPVTEDSLPAFVFSFRQKHVGDAARYYGSAPALTVVCKAGRSAFGRKPTTAGALPRFCGRISKLPFLQVPREEMLLRGRNVKLEPPLVRVLFSADGKGNNTAILLIFLPSKGRQQPH